MLRLYRVVALFLVTRDIRARVVPGAGRGWKNGVRDDEHAWRKTQHTSSTCPEAKPASSLWRFGIVAFHHGSRLVWLIRLPFYASWDTLSFLFHCFYS